MVSVMMNADGLGQRNGCNPSVPTPRVYTSRMYASVISFAASVSRIAFTISSVVYGGVRRIRAADWVIRSRCEASLKTRPL